MKIINENTRRGKEWRINIIVYVRGIICTELPKYYLYRTTLFTRDLSPHKNSLPRSPLFHQGTVENIGLVTLPIYCVLLV
jgi:hypothetical protein